MMRLETGRLVLRNWEDRDRVAFHRLNSDEAVMRFFPFRRTREESDSFMDKLAAGNAGREYGFGAVELKATGECIGMAGLKLTVDVPLRQPEATEIGWRLVPEHQGRGYITEAAEALLAFGFTALGLAEIVSFAVWNNASSIAVMDRLGMSRIDGGDFEHPSVPDACPELRRYVLYAISRERWLEPSASV